MSAVHFIYRCQVCGEVEHRDRHKEYKPRPHVSLLEALEAARMNSDREILHHCPGAEGVDVGIAVLIGARKP